MTRQRVLWALLLAGGVFAADQALKTWVLYGLGLMDGAMVEVTPFFNLILAWNKGVSFSLFDNGDDGRWFIVGFSAIMVVILAVWYSRSGSRLQDWALPIVIGGALGNVVDRLLYGAVVDFLDFHYSGYHWYTFNIADMAIVGGAGLLLLDSFFTPAEQTTE